MRYTRYDFKKKSNDHVFFACVIIIFILSFFIGTGIFKLIFMNQGIKVKGDSLSAKTKNSAVAQSDSKYFIIQCGVNEKQENAQTVFSKLSTIGNPFIVHEGKYYKVIYGIVNEKNYSNSEKLLKNNSIDMSRTPISLSNDDECTSEIRKITDAYLEIVDKLSAKDIKDIQTKSIKQWCQSLEKVNKSDKNYAVLKELMDYTNKFPDRIDKGYIKNLNLFLYNELKKLK
ncbi:hypothetical protein ACJDT4_18275 [Clostridium neuense]|uniref:SPOR domain-containing protein n=1 Tax=Clostridium neuense TaxID=1728934 RepID=A0ABW8TJZ0_9CLOT